ncbi:uncharacterized protein LOC144716348 [Wolffia australiana]
MILAFSPRRSLYIAAQSHSQLTRAYIFLRDIPAPKLSTPFSAAMASKTNLAEAFLLFNIVFFTVASGQLLTNVLGCTGDIAAATACGVALSIVKCDGITPFVTSACRGLIKYLTPQASGQCLCAVATANLLGIKLSVNIPDSINLVLGACGKPNILGC